MNYQQRKFNALRYATRRVLGNVVYVLDNYLRAREFEPTSQYQQDTDKITKPLDS